MRNWNPLLLILLLTIAILYPISSEARRIREGDSVKIDFNPAIQGGCPTLSISPLEKEEPFSGEILVTAYIWEEKEIVLKTITLSGQEPFQMELPNRGQKDYLGVRVEQVDHKGETPKKMGEWRALYFPKGCPLDYKGSQKLKRSSSMKAYWKEAKQKLALVPMNPKIEPVPEKETSTGRCYKVTLNSYWNLPIVCWYYVPKEIDLELEESPPKQYPAIQKMPGWGAEEPPIDQTANGYITLSLNPKSHGPSKEYFQTPIAHHLWNIDIPEDYYYRAAYMDCIRGIDFLSSRSEVDSSRIGVEGSSQGGAFSLAIGALDKRVSCIAASVPYLACFPDFSNLATAGSGPTFMELAGKPDIGKRVTKTLTYIDVANLAPDINVPTLIAVGLQDPVCPPLDGVIVYNRIDNNVPKKLVCDPDSEHEYTTLMRQEHEAWFEKYLLKEKE